MSTESLKIVIGADVSTATTAVKGFAVVVNKAGIDSAKAFDRVSSAAFTIAPALAPVAAAAKNLSNAVTPIAGAFNSLGNVSVALSRIDEVIENSAKDAREFKTALVDLGNARIPLTSILELQAAVANLKADLKGGLTSNISISLPSLNLQAPINNLEQLRAAVKRTQIDLKNGFVPSLAAIPPAANAAATAIKRVDPAARAAGTALTGVGRILQDLPFGFVGIQNNITELPNAFKALSAAAKESGQSIGKTLLSSLTGAGGIGLALSAVTAALTFATVGFGAWERVLGGSSKAAKDAADKTKEFLDSLKSTRDIIDEATGSQQGQIAQVQALASVITDTNAAYDTRKRALEELREVNKNYFGDLTLEQAQLGKVTAAVDEYTKAIVAQAVVKGFTDEISRVAIELNKQEKALKSSQEALERRRQILSKTIRPSTGGTREEAGAVADLSRKYNAAKSAVEAAEDAFKEQRTTVETLRTNYVELSNSIQQATIESLKFRDTQSPEKAKRETDALSKRLQALEKIKDSLKDFSAIADIEEQIFDLKVKITLRDAAKNGLTKEEVDLALKGFRDQLNEAFQKEAISLEASVKVKPQFVQRDERPQDIPLTELAKSLKKVVPQTIILPPIKVTFAGIDISSEFKEAVDQFKIKVREILFNGVVSAFEGIGDSIGTAIGEAISGGGGITGILSRFGESLLKVVGDVMQQIGKQMILASKLVIALKKILQTVGLGVGSLVLGVALVAAGALLKNIKFNTPQFENGGIASGPRSGYLATLHGTELIIPMNKIDKRPRTAGLQGSAGGIVMLQPSLTVDGRSIKVMLNRIDRTDNRIF